MFIQLTEHMVSNRRFPAEACFELLGFDFILDEEQRCQSFHSNLREHIHTYNTVDGRLYPFIP